MSDGRRAAAIITVMTFAAFGFGLIGLRVGAWESADLKRANCPKPAEAPGPRRDGGQG